MRKRRSSTVTGLAAVLGLTLTSGCATTGGSASAAGGDTGSMMLGTAQGGGATFPAPLFEDWIDGFMWEEPFTSITYLSIGSSGGIDGFLAA